MKDGLLGTVREKAQGTDTLYDQSAWENGIPQFNDQVCSSRRRLKAGGGHSARLCFTCISVILVAIILLCQRDN